MHLKSLTLKGFKSFAKPTTLILEPGVTCVVGPNGSGKSNVVDALAWVMGEQGAKSLRGGKMDDVIFAGTATRGPLGRAEVTLTIDNADGALPIDYSEVTIRRTLFRSGGSEYAINGEQVRLLDVQELLSDSGLGREMHVIVGQGRLDSVLRATPEERRGFIEEAAGILKHRRRKEKTVRKLEGMEQNLQRLSDLAAEVRRQLKPLGRQAEVARRAQGIAAIVCDAKARLMADDVVRLRTQLRAANSTEQERSTERMVLQEKLERAVLRIDHLTQAQRGDAVDAARRVAFDLESVRERMRNLQLLTGQRAGMLQQRLDEPALHVTLSPDDVRAARAETEELELRAAEAETAWHEAQQVTARTRADLDALDEEIAAQSALISRFDLRRTELQGKADAAAQRLAGVRGEVLRGENARAAAADRLQTAEAELAEVESQAQASEADSSGLDDAYADASARLEQTQAAVDELRDRRHELARERDALEARATALALAAEVHDGADALLAAHPGVRRLSDKLRVERGFETAITAALGAFADAVLARSAEDAFVLANDAAGLGRVHLVADGEAIADGEFAQAVDAVQQEFDLALKPACEVVSGVDAARIMLARTLIVDELPGADHARAVFARLGFGARLVTRKGEVLDAATLTSPGRGEDEASGSSRLELLAERERATADHERIAAEHDRVALEHADRRAELEAAQQAAKAALAQLRGFDAELAKQREALNRARARVEAARAELGRAERTAELAGQSITEVEERAARAKLDLETHLAQPKPMLDASRRDELVAAVEAAREAEVAARLGLETLRERRRAEQLRASELGRQLEAERAAADAAARETVLRRAELQRVSGVLAQLPPLLASVDRSHAEARAALADAEQARREQDAEIARLRQEENDLRKRLAEITEDVHSLGLQIYERKLQLSNVLERAASELSLSEAVLVDEFGPDRMVVELTAQGEDDGEASASDGEAAPVQTSALADSETTEQQHGEPASAADAHPEPPESGIPFVRAEQEARLKRAERDMAQLGRINPLALEEFAALEQRHAYLNEQLDDLTRTRADLRKIVADIDVRMQEVFKAAFDDTRDAFHEVFPVLFPGGSGDISLTNPDDLLATGIEVAVKPAGKKIDKLSLLSGGERSLAAVALLVAIFKARPSPFYIMDEVEAALDDANLGRLLEVFEDLRRTSQLIIITHQKRTMEIADALYGVSMHRDGVTTVVGQRIREAVRHAEAGAEDPAAI